MPRGITAIGTIVIALAVGAAVALWRSGAPPIRVVASLPEAPGIAVGMPVEYRGIKVGSVENLEFAEAAVLLTLRLDRPDLPLRNTDRVAVRTRGLGERGIAIVPSRDAGQAWQPGDTLQPMPPDAIGSAREAAAQAIMSGAIQQVLARDSIERARRAVGPPP